MQFTAIGIIGLLLILPFLGSVHLFDWDEINFAEAAREMIVRHDYTQITINYEPFWEKPPLFIWMQAACMQLFGINEFAARLPTVLVSIATLLLIYHIGTKHFSGRFGWTWVMMYAGSVLPFFYARTGLIDPSFNLFIFYSFYLLVEATHPEAENKLKFKLGIGIAISLGLAVLTKGPVAVLIFALVYLVLVIRNRSAIFDIKTIVIACILHLSVLSLWILPEILHHGGWFFSTFIKYQVELLTDNVAGHAEPFYYHPLVLFFGCIPAVIFSLPLLFRSKSSFSIEENRWIECHKVLFWVVLILFSIVKTKIIHYSSLCWLPLSFLGASYWHHQISGQSAESWVLKVLASISYFPMLMSIPLMAWLGSHIQSTDLSKLIHDRFVVQMIGKENLWTNSVTVIVLCLFLLFILLFIGVVFLKIRYLPVLVLCQCIILISIFPLFIKPIENVLQGKLISFYQSLSGQEIYLMPYGFKSYAHLFYNQTQPLKENSALSKFIHDYLQDKKIVDLNNQDRVNFNIAKERFLLMQPLDKDLYIVTKFGSNEEDTLKSLKIDLFGQYGGYDIFLKKKASIIFQ